MTGLGRGEGHWRLGSEPFAVANGWRKIAGPRSAFIGILRNLFRLELIALCGSKREVGEMQHPLRVREEAVCGRSLRLTVHSADQRRVHPQADRPLRHVRRRLLTGLGRCAHVAPDFWVAGWSIRWFFGTTGNKVMRRLLALVASSLRAVALAWARSAKPWASKGTPSGSSPSCRKKFPVRRWSSSPSQTRMGRTSSRSGWARAMSSGSPAIQSNSTACFASSWKTMETKETAGPRYPCVNLPQALKRETRTFF